MDLIKEAFSKVKKDIFTLHEEMKFIKDSFLDIKKELTNISNNLYYLDEKIEEMINNSSNSFKSSISTDNSLNSTDKTDISTDNTPLKLLKHQYLPISIGNEGVSTDRQTDRQTDTSTDNNPLKIYKNRKNSDFSTHKTEKIIKNAPIFNKNNKNSIDDAMKILNSLDSLKKEIRLQFKRLTEQELLVFSTIYQLDEEFGHSDYKTLSKRLNLSESSIRDYVQRIISKGIPVDKTKINNKSIQISVSKNLKKIASLNTILQLTEL